MRNVRKLSAIFDLHDVNFDKSDSVYNIALKTVLSSDLANEFLSADEGNEGKQRLLDFIQSRLQGDISIWEPLTKRKILLVLTTK